MSELFPLKYDSEKRLRQAIMVTIDPKTLEILDKFAPNLDRAGIEYLVKALLRKAGLETKRRDKTAGLNFKEYMTKHPKGER